MRIGLILYGRLELLTGGFLYDRFLVDSLRSRGHRVEVLSLAWKPYAVCLLDNLSNRLDGRVRRGGWELILQDGLCHPSLIRINQRTRARGGPPMVAVVHQVLCRQPRHRLLNRAYGQVERAYLRTVDAMLVNSPDTHDQVRRLVGGGFPACIAPPGGDRLGSIDSQSGITERSFRPGPLELLFVGNLSPVKGLLPLIEALACLDSVPWRLTVVGGEAPAGWLARRTRLKTCDRAPRGNVRFSGRLEGYELRDVFVRSQVFVMPFAHEGFGIAALEAMAFGLPVIGSTAGGVKAFVKDGVNGFLVAPGDRGEVCRRLHQMHTDRERLARMGAAALKTALEHPGWEDSMARAARFVESLTGC